MILDLGRSNNPMSQSVVIEMDQPNVFIVDDDPSMREALSELILSAGLQPVCYASIDDLLQCDALDRPGCLILDVRLPGASGLDLQQHLVQTGNAKPIIFLTGYGDIPMSVQAIKAGAVDFLTKPVRDQTLLDAVSKAIALDNVRRAELAIARRNHACFEQLTAREREVLRELARGHLNKQIAHNLGISEGTAKLHRSNVKRKMQATSIGQLIRAWETLPAVVREAEGTRSAPTHSRAMSAAE